MDKTSNIIDMINDENWLDRALGITKDPNIQLLIIKKLLARFNSDDAMIDPLEFPDAFLFSLIYAALNTTDNNVRVLCVDTLRDNNNQIFQKLKNEVVDNTEKYFLHFINTNLFSEKEINDFIEKINK